MKELRQCIAKCSAKLGLSLLGIHAFALPAFAQQPSQALRETQPAIILALALTILVLLVFYLIQRKRKPVNHDRNMLTGNRPLKNKIRETHNALESLFDHHDLPMAKLSLEKELIVDVSPSLLKNLGYSNKELIGKAGDTIGFIPGSLKNSRSLADKGWSRIPKTALVNSSGQNIRCSILNIVIDNAPVPFILSFVSNIAGANETGTICSDRANGVQTEAHRPDILS
ncbi:MAG: hypothetical protein MI892_09780 [Desulfobacterales bacterium]|nr:hypothetical protein [Desulfobacterales bacterium]